MKLLKKILFTVLIVTGIGILVAMDFADRAIFYSRRIPEEEIKEFTLCKTIDEIQKAYERHYGNPKYSFPRGNVEKVKIYKNQLLTSRITSKTLSKEDAEFTVDFFNNPDNFDWGETTWSLNESEYILRFFDTEDKEIGKIWLCIEGCGMTASIPFSPHMKFGGLNSVGRERLNRLLKRINEK
jgi:hypothetical protein